MSEASKASAPALEKATRVMQYLSEQSGACNLTEICKATGLPKSSTFTLLSTMEGLGLARREGNAYTLGMRLYTLGNQAFERTISTKSYLPALQKLRDETGFTTHFSMYDSGRIIVLDKLDGRGVLQFKAYKGERKRLNTSAGGKALAAFLSEREIEVSIAEGFDRFTDHSIADVSEFLRHLESIRRAGYAIDDGEGEVGVRCLGAPVFLYGGQIFGAVSLTTIASQLPLDSIHRYASLVLDAAAHMSRALAYTGPYPLPQCNPNEPNPYLAQISTRT